MKSWNYNSSWIQVENLSSPNFATISYLSSDHIFLIFSTQNPESSMFYGKYPHHWFQTKTLDFQIFYWVKKYQKIWKSMKLLRNKSSWGFRVRSPKIYGFKTSLSPSSTLKIHEFRHIPISPTTETERRWWVWTSGGETRR